MSYYYNNAPMGVYPRRTGDIHVQLNGRTPPSSIPVPQPPELRSMLSEVEWQERTVQLWNHYQKWNWSRLERVGLMMAFMLSLVVPIIASVVVNHFEFHSFDVLQPDSTVEQIDQRMQVIRKANAISSGVSIGFLTLLWVPYLIVKSIANRRLAKILDTYNLNDSSKGSMQALRWTIVQASTFQRSATICISLPPAFLQAHQPTNFSEGAYLPPYLAQQPHILPSHLVAPIKLPPAKQMYEGEAMRSGMGLDRNSRV